MYRTKRCLVSALVSATILSNSLAAQAGGMSHIGTYGGNHGTVPVTTGPGCKQPGPVNHSGGQTSIDNSIHVYKPTTITNNVNVYKPTTIDNNITVYKPISIDKNINVTTNIDNSKNINIYKPVSITTDIDNSKNINITKTIDNSKYIDNSKHIDNSKNININKNIVINKSNSEADALATAAAIAEASASAVASANAIAAALANSNSSSNATINFSAASNNASNASANSASASFANANANANANAYAANGNLAGVFVTSVAPEAPAAFAGGEIGNLSVSVEIAPPPVAVAQQCTIQAATVVKAIHAICISEDRHEFPASHMLGDTWINASYEGEVARCLPGSRLKIVMGKVTQSTEGMAAGTSSGQVLQCAVHEALRHYKDGALKCAPAVSVPDCTERTNLRRYGTGDMFFSYRARICLETHEEYAEQTSSEYVGRQSRFRESGTAY